MICAYVLAVCFIVLTQGCTWIPKVEQEDYCRVEYGHIILDAYSSMAPDPAFAFVEVFVAEAKETPVLESLDYKHDIAVKKAYKFDGNKEEVLAFNTLYGNGPYISCGEELLTKGKSYLIYGIEFTAGVIGQQGMCIPHRHPIPAANKDTSNGKIHISEYRSMERVNDADIERMTTKYDCNCTIKINYSKLVGNGPGVDLPPPTIDECNVPDNYCSRGFYCQRNSDGRCTNGVFGDCS